MQPFLVLGYMWIDNCDYCHAFFIILQHVTQKCIAFVQTLGIVVKLPRQAQERAAQTGPTKLNVHNAHYKKVIFIP